MAFATRPAWRREVTRRGEQRQAARMTISRQPTFSFQPYEHCLLALLRPQRPILSLLPEDLRPLLRLTFPLTLFRFY